MKKNYSAIDIFKLICALFIIGLHIGIWIGTRNTFYVINVVFRLGVPFFFLCNGFFLSENTKIENKNAILKKYIKKLIIPYFFWSLLLIPYSLYFSHNFTSLSIINAIYKVLIGCSPTIMWYVGSLIISCIILIHINSKKQFYLSLYFALFLYLIGLLFNTHCYLLLNTRFSFLYTFLTSNFQSNSNVFFCGYFWVALGIYINRFCPKSIINLKNQKIYLYILYLVLSFILLIGEVYLVSHHHDLVRNSEYYLSHLFVIPLIFIILYNINLHFDTKIIRKMSSTIYYSHYLFVYVFIYIRDNLHFTLFNNPNITYVVLCIFMLFLSYLLVKLNNIYVNKVI
jgi:surface polysaccharide O-acyltransferase-like enzyme